MRRAARAAARVPAAVATAVLLLVPAGVTTAAATAGLPGATADVRGAVVRASVPDEALVVVSPATVDVVAPLPGHAETWTMTVTRAAGAGDDPLPIWLAVSGADGPLLRGDHPLTLTVTDEDGTDLLTSSDVSSLLGRQVTLPDLVDGTTLTARVELPAEASDAYLGARGSVRLAVTAQAPASPPAAGGVLARTGAAPAGLALAALALLGVGGTALASRRNATARSARATTSPQPRTGRTPEETR